MSNKTTAIMPVRLETAIIEEERSRLHRAVLALEARPLTARRLQQVSRALAIAANELQAVLTSRRQRNAARRR